MNRAVRNRLASLLLGTFDDPAKRDAVLWLALFFELCGAQRRRQIGVRDLEEAWPQRYPELAAHPGTFAEAALELKGVIEVHRPGDAMGHGPQGPESVRAFPPWCEPHPDVLPFLAVVGERVRAYADVVRSGAEDRKAFERLEPLRRGVAEAAACFNAGLFFEAHEHLEGRWRDLTPTPTKRYVQGLIQISVGFHHAMRGTYQGAVNQLAKGLSKLGDAPEGALGLDCDRFAREVEATRKDIVTRGRQRMRKATLQELPRMHIRS
jgi:hypothetical protein